MPTDLTNDIKIQSLPNLNNFIKVYNFNIKNNYCDEETGKRYSNDAYFDFETPLNIIANSFINNKNVFNEINKVYHPIIDKNLTDKLENLATNILNSKDGIVDWDFPNFLEFVYGWDLLNLDNRPYSAENLSIPDVKLYYPEPFIASPSFVHDDIWFMHILHFQYWLWFMFISLIILYFIVFINVVRWCNIRNKPKRETRGVSRSKCADIITACVPVSWAAAIIISESVDATDYYDGFGTGEVVIGIRAYQWGWEYYYPKAIDTSYNVNTSYSVTAGNSLKYSNSGTNLLNKNNLWKFYKNKNLGKTTCTPSHLILAPSDNNNVISFMNFNDFGANTAHESSAFKKIQSFSKSNSHRIFNNNSEFYSNYKKISDMYLTDYNSSNVSSYGTFRQSKFSSLSSTINLNNSLLDDKSIKKYLSYNHNLDNNPHTLSNKLDLISNLIDFNSNDKINKNFSIFSKYKNLEANNNLVNKPENTLKFFLSQSNSSDVNYDWLDSLYSDKDLVISNKKMLSFLNNKNNIYTFDKKTLKNSSNDVANSNMSLRVSDNLTFEETNKKCAFDAHMVNKNQNSIVNNQVALYNKSSNYWLGSGLTNKLSNSNTIFTFSYSPFSSNNFKKSTLDFDKYTDYDSSLFDKKSLFTHSELNNLDKNKLQTELDIKLTQVNTPDVIKTGESSSTKYLFNSYWLSLWSNIQNTNRYTNLINIDNMSRGLYFPLIINYAEYDFRNWQAIELLEDAFWESSYSSFSNDEYIRIKDQVANYKLFNKMEKPYNRLNRLSISNEFDYDPIFLSSPLLLSKLDTDYLSIFSEDTIINSNFIALKNCYSFNSEVLLDGLEDSYENIKFTNSLLNLNNKNLFSITGNFQNSISYTSLLNAYNYQYQEYASHKNHENVEDVYTDYSDLSYNTNLRVLNPLKLRSSSRSSIVMFNAIQKVFKPRFDEGRAHARLQDFSNSFVKHPFITAERANYESLLGKNKESFFNVNNYNQFFIKNFNNTFIISNSLNVYFSELPFLVSAKSDLSRYLWFDWYSKWSSLEIQPSSAARYSLLGVPYSNKSFEYNSVKSRQINDSEGYVIRLAKARRNYMSNWSYTPYLYNKITSWYKSNDLNSQFNFSMLNLLSIFELSLSNQSGFVNANNYLIKKNYSSTPSFSGVNTPYRSSWRPTTGIQSFYYNSSIFVDILSKREYCYREYFLNKNKILTLPLHLVASPQNPLLLELKNSYSLLDPITFGSEITRELFYGNLNNWRNILLKNIFLTLSKGGIKPKNLESIADYLFLDINNYTKTLSMLEYNKTLYKNQYRPVKKGIANMIRLHATGAIAMPIEIRLHIIASSKDIIHSWSIPSAGIKIDCVPGFSSHRVTIFLVSGIFWGQCMEICGRFHHWMPIIVYFMKRDLFFLWCIHFVHYSNKENSYTMTNKQLNNSMYLASYDKNFWVEELTKNL